MTVLTTDRVANIKTLLQFWFTRWNSSTNRQTRLGVRALLIIVRLIVDKKTVQRWFPRTWNSSTRTAETWTWRTGAANHRSTDRGQENSSAALVSAQWNSSTKNSTDFGVRALLIIVRLIVDKKTVQRRWFPQWNSSTKNGTGRLGVMALLIIARLTVDE
ncbi:hypothetical protein EVAR_28739_1 [Eumeta japonica]|uniref:Uncharacterized protein n=1 Tax=Eumeta variegata TaxID=151549 RepID=A0A4C1Z291_EUMVA|nr:hypothetical protein EVAR_28739_1 [Eumeta japonica]